jgi:hypothetical protein
VLYLVVIRDLFVECGRSCLVLLVAALLGGTAIAEPVPGAAALRERETALAPRLRASPFGQPLLVESIEAGELASGDVYAVLPHPYGLVDAALVRPQAWCDVLILHLNVKRCVAGRDRIALHIGTKHAQPIELARELELAYAVGAHADDYLQVEMLAQSGPLGTRDYGIRFEAIPRPSGQTFVHFRYTVGYGPLAHLAMRGYLSTIGAGKIGFSVERAHDGEPARVVGGVRGAVERNAMRYYLAIAAYLDSLLLPEAERVPRRLQAWFDATERYPAQLHEIDRGEYLAMKREELR